MGTAATTVVESVPLALRRERVADGLLARRAGGHWHHWLRTRIHPWRLALRLAVDRQ